MKFKLLGLVVTASAAVGAAEFPYGVEESAMTVRHSAEAAVVESLAEPVPAPKVGDGMPNTDSIATVSAVFVDFKATDAEEWETAQASVGAAQASLAMKRTGDAIAWMGRSGGSWIELTGVSAAEGAWNVKIEIDYSLGADQRKVRYSVKADDAGEWTPLKQSDAASPWLAVGKDAERIGRVLVGGCAKTGAVVAKSGVRPIAGTVETVADYGLNYNRLTLDIGVRDSWGVSKVEVTLRNSRGGDLSVLQADVVDGAARVDLSGKVLAGESYTYDVKLVGGYNGAAQEVTVSEQQKADMFVGSDSWFAFRSGALVDATGSNVTIENQKLSTAGDTKGVVTPVAPEPVDARTTLDMTLAVAGTYAEGDLPTSVPQFALTVVRLATGSRTWMGWNGTGWTALSGAGVSAENGTYDVRFSLDYAAHALVYAIKVGGSFVTLADAQGVGTFALPSVSLKDVALYGGCVSAFNAAYRATGSVSAAVDEANATIDLQANSTVDLAKLGKTQYAIENQATGKRFHLRWTDSVSNGATLDGGALKLISKPVNGLESFDSYALGLDPTKELAKPAAVVKPGGTQSATGITVHVPNVVKENLPQAGVEVLFQRQKSVDGGKTWTDDGDPAKVGGELTIPFIEGTLYRVNTVLK